MEWISGNIFIRPLGGIVAFEQNKICAGHTHNFDHTSIFFNGKWRVRKWQPVVNEDGSPTGGWVQSVMIEREGPFHLLIEANAKHEFTYLSEGIGKAWCVYSHRTPQGDVVQEYTGWQKAYE